ncbi:MAG: hypothetical protein IT553_11325 [Sphingomonadaceae bacterium]|nr:hypothetical protein [Sphingomonadaceae bacterium]
MATKFASPLRAASAAVLAGSMVLTAMPASAQRYERHRDRYHDGISAGEVIAGAVIIGGLAAILSGGGRDRNDRRYDPRYGNYDNRYDGYYDGYNWDSYGGSREAIQRCVRAVERRGGYGADTDVRRITDIDRIRGGYRVQGNVAVDYRRGYRNDWRDRDGRYGRDWDGRQRYDDRGRFTCTVRYGRVQDVDFRGL